MLRRFLVPAFLLVAASASAQPTITDVTPGYGGAGPNSPTTYTITGTGFDTRAKFTRFVDASGNDLFDTVTCASATTCTASGVRPFLLGAGVVAPIQVKVRATNTLSVSGVSFIYYGAPTISSVTPGFGVVDATTPFVVNGGGFTSTAGGFPGTTSIQLGSTTTDLASGCGSTAACSGSAPSLTGNPSAVMGRTPLEVRTPGGAVQTSWFYATNPNVNFTHGPSTITSVSASTGPVGGGNVITIVGAGFVKGTLQPIAGYSLTEGTHFIFVTPAGSVPATDVNCPEVGRCYVTVPPGVAGPVGLQVYTACGHSVINCTTNTLPIVGKLSALYRGLYAFAGIKLTPGALGPIVVSENGVQATYKVSLYGPPTASVHVDVGVLSAAATASPASLDFTPTNWAEPQTVTVTGLDDGGAVGDTAFTVRNIASSSDPNYAGATADQAGLSVDNDSKRYVVWPQSGLVTTRSGGTATFSIVLTLPPTTQAGGPGQVTSAFVDLNSSAPTAGTVTNITSNPPPPPPPFPWVPLFFSSEPGVSGYSLPRIVTITGHDDGTPGIRRDYSMLVTGSGDPLDLDFGYGSIVPPDVHVTNVDPPATPTVLGITRMGNDRAAVSWSTNADVNDYYRIKYSLTPGGPKTLLASSAMSGQTVTGLTVGQQYYFVVSAVNEGGESADSAEKPFVMNPPPPPIGFDGDSKSDMVVISLIGSNYFWRVRNSVGGFTTTTNVLFNAISGFVFGDFDGDQRLDPAIYSEPAGAWLYAASSNGAGIQVNWGGPGYLPVLGDYDGDGKADPAVYRKSDGQWSILKSSTNYTAAMFVNLGGAGYTPVPGQDFDGDFRADVAVYNQNSGTWYVLLSSTNYTTSINRSWGGRGYTLVPGDYDADGKSDFGLYQRATGNWYVLLSGAGYTTAINKSWGGVNYMPVPGDYDGDGRNDLAVYDLTTSNWYVLRSSNGYTTSLAVTGWSTTTDIPVSSAISFLPDDMGRASDADGDGRADFTVYNTTSGDWMSLTSTSGYAGGITSNNGGTGNDAEWGDYDGDGRADRGIFQNGFWAIQLSATNFTTKMFFGSSAPGTIAVPGDFDGDGKTDFLRYSADGHWSGAITAVLGGFGFAPVAADFDGDGRTDFGVYNASTGFWSIRLSTTAFSASIEKSVGGTGWIPVPADYDGDGKADFVLYNSTSGQWYGLTSASNFTTTLNVSWGGTGYAPVKGDYDGDGKADLAVYRASTGTYYVLLSGSSYTTTVSKSLGGPGFVAVPTYR